MFHIIFIVENRNRVFIDVRCDDKIEVSGALNMGCVTSGS